MIRLALRPSAIDCAILAHVVGHAYDHPRVMEFMAINHTIVNNGVAGVDHSTVVMHARAIRGMLSTMILAVLRVVLSGHT